MFRIKHYLAAGFLFTSVLGTLSHFFYDWSGRNPLAALISPVNESIWEHMKLLFFPALLWSLFTPRSLRKDLPSLRPSLHSGILLGTLCIPVLFYTYSGVLGRTYTAVDIGIFFVSTAAAFLTAWKLNSAHWIQKWQKAIFLLTLLSAILFFVFTFLPPDAGLFYSASAQ